MEIDGGSGAGICFPSKGLPAGSQLGAGQGSPRIAFPKGAFGLKEGPAWGHQGGNPRAQQRPAPHSHIPQPWSPGPGATQEQPDVHPHPQPDT